MAHLTDDVIGQTIRRMVWEAGMTIEMSEGDNATANIEFKAFPRRTLSQDEYVSMVMRQRIIGEGMNSSPHVWLSVEQGPDGSIIGEEGVERLTAMVAEAIAQKTRYDEIVGAGGDPLAPPLNSLTMHRIGLLMLGGAVRDVSVERIAENPHLVVHEGGRRFPIIGGRIRESPLQQQTIRNDEGKAMMVFKDRIAPGVTLPVILPDTVIMAMETEKPDLAEVVRHEMLGDRVGVRIISVTKGDGTTHLHLEDVQDPFPTGRME